MGRQSKKKRMNSKARRRLEGFITKKGMVEKNILDGIVLKVETMKKYMVVWVEGAE